MHVNVHDVCPTTGMLRMVGPEELYADLKAKVGTLFKTVSEGSFGHEEGRVDYGSFKINGHEIYFQDCGLFAGDEYINFTEKTPKELIDKILAVMVLTYSKSCKRFRLSQVTEGLPKIGNLTITDPAMFLAKEKGEVEKLVSEMEKDILEREKKANYVLQGKSSYFDDVLKDYNPSPTMAVAMLESAVRSLKRRDFVEKKGKELSLSEVEVYLLQEYFDWKSRGGEKDWLFKTFKERIECHAKPSTVDFGKEYAKYARDKRRLARLALKDVSLIEKITKLGEQLYLELEVKKDESRM